jgi:hypothetical protein
LKSEGLVNKTHLALKLLNICAGKNLNIVDKAKPRVIVGRKATGPNNVGIAGLPKHLTDGGQAC